MKSEAIKEIDNSIQFNINKINNNHENRDNQNDVDVNNINNTIKKKIDVFNVENSIYNSFNIQNQSNNNNYIPNNSTYAKTNITSKDNNLSNLSNLSNLGTYFTNTITNYYNNDILNAGYITDYLELKHFITKIIMQSKFLFQSVMENIKLNLRENKEKEDEIHPQKSERYKRDERDKENDELKRFVIK